MLSNEFGKLHFAFYGVKQNNLCSFSYMYLFIFNFLKMLVLLFSQ